MLQALKTAREQGHRIFINTGRGKACIPDQILALPLDGIVSGCGCTVTVDGKDVYSVCPRLSVVHSYLTEIFERGQRCFLEGENRLFRINCPEEDVLTDPNFAEYCAIARLDFSRWQPLTHAGQIFDWPDARLPKLNIVGKFTEDDLAHFVPHYDGVVNEYQIEVYTKGNNKATGMRYVMEHYFPGYQSVAIGDSVNDTDMLAAADLSIAMGNAPDRIKALCDKVTENCDEDGMGKAVLRLCEETTYNNGGKL